jgi:hypothetical protein
MGKFKFKESKVGKFLSEHGAPVLHTVLDVADDIYPPLGLVTKAAEGLGLTGAKKEELNEAIKEYAIDREKHLEMILKDKADARDMQKVALNQSDNFSKRFIYYYAIFWGVVSAAFIFIILFAEIPEKNSHYVDTLMGFLIGTIISTIIAFFYGSSKGSMDKQEAINKKL